MILETELYFAAENRRTNGGRQETGASSSDDFVKVSVSCLYKIISISKIVIAERVGGKGVEVTVNPIYSKFLQEGRARAVDVAPVVPNISGDKDRDKGGRLGTTPKIPLDIGEGEHEREAGRSKQALIDSLYNINGHGGHSNVNLPGGEASEGWRAGVAETAGAIAYAIARGVKAGIEAAKDAEAAAGGGLGEAGLIRSIALPAAAAAAGEVLLDAAAIAALAWGTAKLIEKAVEPAKTPNPEAPERESKVTVVPLGGKPTTRPVNPALDNIIEKQDEPLFVFKQRGQAIDPQRNDDLPELGGDMVLVFNTGQGVTDPQYDKTKVIGTFSFH